MTFPHSPQPGPPGDQRPVPPQDFDPRSVEGTGHPAVDAVLRSLANAVPLSPADQIAEYEAAHRILQETLSNIDG